MRKVLIPVENEALMPPNPLRQLEDLVDVFRVDF